MRTQYAPLCGGRGGRWRGFPIIALLAAIVAGPCRIPAERNGGKWRDCCTVSESWLNLIQDRCALAAMRADHARSRLRSIRPWRRTASVTSAGISGRRMPIHSTQHPNLIAVEHQTSSNPLRSWNVEPLTQCVGIYSGRSGSALGWNFFTPCGYVAGLSALPKCGSRSSSGSPCPHHGHLTM